MMSSVILRMPAGVHTVVRQHLLPEKAHVEEAAFIYATYTDTTGSRRLEYCEWWAVPADGFASRSANHLELSDTTRGAVIKRAHDLGVCLIEFHSHVGPWPARFSPSDLSGFEDFVPHVFWRLKGRPYAAVVVARTGFDAFVWMTDPRMPERLTGIDAGGGLLFPSGLSPLTIDDEEYEF